MKTPLRMHKDYENLYMDADNKPIFDVNVYDGTLHLSPWASATKEVREYILTAVNTHAELLSALKALSDIAGHRWNALPKDSHEKKCLTAARAAIRRAEEGQG